MKATIICLSMLISMSVISCESAPEGTTSTDNPDTSVLVSDPDNTLDANPVNDTIVSDTVQHMEH